VPLSLDPSSLRISVTDDNTIDIDTNN